MRYQLRFPVHRSRFLSVLAVSVATLLTFGCSGDRPAVIWSPAPVTQRIEPNGFRLISLSFISDTVLNDVSLQVTPSLRPYVTITPPLFGHVEANLAKPVWLLVAMPSSATPGRHVVGLVQMRTGRRALAPAAMELQLVASTPQGTLESLRTAMVARDAAAYARQFVPDRQALEREIFEQLADVALDRLVEALQSAEQVSVGNDDLTAEFKIRVRIDPHRTETTILLRRSAEDEIWRVARF